MNIFLTILLLLALLALFITLIRQSGKNKTGIAPITDEFKTLLSTQVPFYQQLNEDKKIEFENRVQHFLAGVRITGVKTKVEDIDRVLIAASAVIPIFNFTGWEYVNLHEVLLYPDSFNHDFEQEGANRSVLGMVGSGALNGIMILSQHELRQAFINKTGKSNTAIHEFVHLVDKTDGAIDGIPEFILQKEYVVPWLQLMHREIKNIMTDRSDIDPYGATNEAEFFAVAAEYFFERPDLFKQKHPELYELMAKIFNKKSV